MAHVHLDPSDSLMITLTGPDRPGITSEIAGLLGEGGMFLLDVEQVVVQGVLNLTFVVGNAEGTLEARPILKDLLWKARELGLHIDFQLGGRPAARRPKQSWAVTLLSPQVSAHMLAGAASVFEFVPVVGPLAGMVLSVSVALFSGYPHWGWMIVFLLVYRVFQDYVLSPWLLSSGVELHPLLVLFGVLVGETVAGIPGLFLSVPVMASMRVVYRHLR